mgnify:CR=1 FL=1
MEEIAEEQLLDSKNMLVMKLLHYFIIDKNYNPIILQGAENEIWLENLDEDYRIVRIVTGTILNEEQFGFSTEVPYFYIDRRLGICISRHRLHLHIISCFGST